MISDKVEDIQSKLHKKVLPFLNRHILQTKGENTTIRAFVAVSIAKVIRKLPVDLFSLHLQKLVNLIVVKGLREKDLNTREKARKALIKVIGEVSPRFLTLILQEMGNNLNRGFQLHVYLYTVHYVFNYMKDQMVSGQVTTQMVHLISPLLLREMFGDLLEERKATEETTKKHIKESKARKAMPIYEVFAQFIDFKTSFLELVQPIVKVLEDNPSHSAI
jgi:U3 small nucleolar RNA-associated protein 20